MINKFQLLLEQHNRLAKEFQILKSELREKLNIMREYNRCARKHLEESRKAASGSPMLLAFKRNVPE